jgi:hypothetical protein
MNGSPIRTFAEGISDEILEYFPKGMRSRWHEAKAHALDADCIGFHRQHISVARGTAVVPTTCDYSMFTW